MTKDAQIRIHRKDLIVLQKLAKEQRRNLKDSFGEIIEHYYYCEFVPTVKFLQTDEQPRPKQVQKS